MTQDQVEDEDVDEYDDIADILDGYDEEGEDANDSDLEQDSHHTVQELVESLSILLEDEADEAVGVGVGDRDKELDKEQILIQHRRSSPEVEGL